MITQKSVQEILDTVKIEDVVQDFVSLRRRGTNLIGLCPFHHEKTPSFNVSPARNIFKCFGCGKGGNAVQFLMELERFTFPEALKYIAKKYGIQIEEIESSREAAEERRVADSLYIINQYALEFFQNQLVNTDRGRSVGLSYFRERGFREETIQKFGLGYAPEKRDQFLTTATAAGYDQQMLFNLGLCSPPDASRNLPPRDFFRDRVIFPIHGMSGKVIAFAGRIMAKDVKAPKYINSPETDIYLKSKVLYGAYQARKAIREKDECILVEGYTDVISLHQAGIENVVASSGTALTVEQIGLIKRNTNNIKILYDGDPAGIKAALRGLDLVLEQDLNVRIVLLPDREDPDSYLARVGATAFTEYIARQAKDFILFKADLLMQEAGSDPVKRSGVVRDIVTSIAKIPDPVKRSLFVQECARVAQVDEAILMSETNKLVLAQMQKRHAPGREGERSPADVSSDTDAVPVPAGQAPEQEAARKANVVGDEFQEKDIARILIAFSHEEFDKDDHLSVAEYIISNIEDVLDEFDNPLYAKVAREVLACLANRRSQLNTNYFLHHSDPEISLLAVNLLSEPYEYSENWANRWEIYLRMQKMPDDNFQEDSLQALKRFKLRKIMRMSERNHTRIKELTAAGDMERLAAHLKVHQRLLEIRNELALELGTVVLK
ncbi:MAG TPA: DNA primase [Saprospiraceae bacterium]|nr:DNA primase [Saprospiraceae bacterium]